jgi:Transposase IS116/IS110/IS902 family
MSDIDTELLPPVKRLTRDLASAASTMTDEEARYLVDAYYQMQENRKRSANQERAMEEEPHAVLGWLTEQSDTLEAQIKRALDKYSDGKLIGRWAKSVHGIGPVIAAGLMAHVDPARNETVGHIWRFAGLDPTVEWKKGEKRPWNASLKVLCWKIGQSFMKFAASEDCVYGHVYRKRKEYEIARNDRGDNAEKAAEILKRRNFGKSTEAYKHLIAGHLPPAQIDARARRYAVKLFLSHYHHIGYFIAKGELPPLPYAIAFLQHAHMIEPPGVELIPGLAEATAASPRRRA